MNLTKTFVGQRCYSISPISTPVTLVITTRWDKFTKKNFSRNFSAFKLQKFSKCFLSSAYIISTHKHQPKNSVVQPFSCQIHSLRIKQENLPFKNPIVILANSRMFVEFPRLKELFYIDLSTFFDIYRHGFVKTREVAKITNFLILLVISVNISNLGTN